MKREHIAAGHYRWTGGGVAYEVVKDDHPAHPWKIGRRRFRTLRDADLWVRREQYGR